MTTTSQLLVGHPSSTRRSLLRRFSHGFVFHDSPFITSINSRCRGLVIISDERFGWI
ncbi:hypothetical protein LINPERHAP1_LOCUS14527 [Linum perenne]